VYSKSAPSGADNGIAKPPDAEELPLSPDALDEVLLLLLDEPLPLPLEEPLSPPPPLDEPLSTDEALLATLPSDPLSISSMIIESGAPSACAAPVPPSCPEPPGWEFDGEEEQAGSATPTSTNASPMRRSFMSDIYSRRRFSEQAAGANRVCLEKYVRSIRCLGSSVSGSRDVSRNDEHTESHGHDPRDRQAGCESPRSL
jgi:hypothetical protein